MAMIANYLSDIAKMLDLIRTIRVTEAKLNSTS